MKNSKRILSVTIKHMLDDSPDTSWLGEYSDTRTSEFSIDRAHDTDCESVVAEQNGTLDKLERIANHIQDMRDQLWDSGIEEDSPEDTAYNEAMARIIDIKEELAECGCIGDNWNRREYRYFNPSLNYVDKSGNPRKAETPETVRKYTLQDYERMESLNSGYWQFIGIEALAEIQVTGDNTQEITSGGLWGVESDSDKSYIKQVEDEQLAELRSQLKALGFSTRAISKAFQNVERKGE